MADNKVLFENCLITGKPIKNKKWYKVTAEITTDLYAFVEAESEQEAYEKARWHDEPDGGAYVEDDNDGWGGDWIVGSDPTEVTTEKEKEQLQKWLDK